MAWELLLVLLVALGASLLSLFSGFGLGTLLLPAFALVFPLHVAVAATALVHLVNSGVKAALLGRHAHAPTVVRFGLPALAGAAVGALLLQAVPTVPFASYELLGRREVSGLGVTLGCLIFAFGLAELLPRIREARLDPRWLVAGGLVSGFFGGLSGHQGAIRSMALGRLGLGAAAFVATGAVCAVLVDLVRLGLYGGRFAADAAGLADAGGWPLVAGAVAMAMVGTVAGSRLLPHATVPALRTLVGVLLLALGLALALGLL